MTAFILLSKALIGKAAPASKPCPHLHWRPSFLYPEYEKCETCGAIRRIGL